MGGSSYNSKVGGSGILCIYVGCGTLREVRKHLVIDSLDAGIGLVFLFLFFLF